MSLVSFLFPSRQQRWFELPTTLIDFQVKCVPFSPISGRFGCKILERCLSKLSVATTGAEGRLCNLRLSKSFVVKANYNLATKRHRKLTFCLLLPNSSFVENHSVLYYSGYWLTRSCLTLWPTPYTRIYFSGTTKIIAKGISVHNTNPLIITLLYSASTKFLLFSK